MSQYTNVVFNINNVNTWFDIASVRLCATAHTVTAQCGFLNYKLAYWPATLARSKVAKMTTWAIWPLYSSFSPLRQTLLPHHGRRHIYGWCIRGA